MFRISFKYKNRKDGTWKIIFVVNGSSYVEIISNKRLFIECTRCRVNNDFNVSFYAINMESRKVSARIQ